MQEAEWEWVARDFGFHTGEVVPELKLHYTTVGAADGEPVLVLHGTTGSAASMLTDAFAGALFGPGRPLDARKYFVIVPDALGHGRSAKPSDGLRTKFPRYNYDDMVAAQHRLVTEGLGIGHLRLAIGHSMGGMQAWIWGVRHPGFVDALVPMASQPGPISGRNRAMRRAIIDSIRNDPDWNDGDYASQPKVLKRLVDERLAASFGADANDTLYQWDASRDYDPSAGLERIRAAVLAVNSADDERNPPETGVVERAIGRMPNARLHLIPAGDGTSGHGTTARAKFYAEPLRQLLRDALRIAGDAGDR